MRETFKHYVLLSQKSDVSRLF